MPRLVLRGGMVFDGERMTAADVSVEGGRISGIGTDLDGDIAVDLAGRSVIPGLFDCHVHLTIADTDFWKAVQQPFSYRFFEAVRNLRLTLAAGITTVRDAGGADLGVKQAVEHGLVPGPQVLISITMICQTGGHTDPWLPSGQCVAALFPAHPGVPDGVADGVDAVRRKTREIVRAGADVVKVAASGGVLSARDDPRHPHLRPDELSEIVQEAAATGRAVMAHAHSAEGIKAAVRAGVRSIEHGVYLDDECLELMARHRTYLVPTLTAAPRLIAAIKQGASLPESALRQAEELTEIHQSAFARAVAAGVPIAMGTDSGVGPHGSNLDELVAMRDAGMPAAAVLRSATVDAARLTGLYDTVGEIVVGKRADLVVLDGDPLASFDSLAGRIAMVYQNGELVHERPDPAR